MNYRSVRAGLLTAVTAAAISAVGFADDWRDISGAGDSWGLFANGTGDRGCFDVWGTAGAEGPQSDLSSAKSAGIQKAIDCTELGPTSYANPHQWAAADCNNGNDAGSLPE